MDDNSVHEIVYSPIYQEKRSLQGQNFIFMHANVIAMLEDSVKLYFSCMNFMPRFLMHETFCAGMFQEAVRTWAKVQYEKFHI